MSLMRLFSAIFWEVRTPAIIAPAMTATAATTATAFHTPFFPPDFLGGVSGAAAEQTEISVKYAGYLEKQETLIRKARQAEETRLAEDIPYEQIDGLRLEARQKLARQKPVSLGAAGRIPGVNPADVAVLSVWLEKEKRAARQTRE